MSFLAITFQLLRILGAIGLFLFGMKLMSESLQKVAGVRLRHIVKSMISSKIKAIFSGIAVTAVIQASSATTVMMVSFVNAGLLTLTESIGVVMGANIGTTIKLWFIVGLGLKFNLNYILLPLIGFSFPLLFSKNGARKSWGEFVMGFSLLFLGIDFLISLIPDIQSNTDFFIFLQHFSGSGYGSIIIFVMIGMMITASVQSSSATIAFTLIMSLNGLLSYEQAAAMILGENIGTTITANIAAIIANRSAKKAALAHTIFNISGVIWMLIIFHPFLSVIDWIVFKFWGVYPSENQNYIPVALCFFHTFFNVCNTFLWIAFIPFMLKLLHFLIPDHKKKEKFQLKNIRDGLLSTSELSIDLLQKELYLLSKINVELFKIIPLILMEKDEKVYKKLFQRLNKTETKMHKKIQEISYFLTSLTQDDLSKNRAAEIANMFKIIDIFENNNKNFAQMVQLIDKKNNSKIWFTQLMRNNLLSIIDWVNLSFERLISRLEPNNKDHNTSDRYDVDEEIKILLNQYNYSNDYELTFSQISKDAVDIHKQLIINCELIVSSNKKIISLI